MLGLSASTVSSVLYDSGPVTPEQRNRVLDAVQAREYSPNESPRNLERRSASTIGTAEP